MPRFQPLQTRFGVLRGRETLEALSLELRGDALHLTAALRLEGEAARPCRMEFSGVRCHRVTVLDDFPGNLESCFDEVLDSPWCVNDHKHFQVITYHYALEVMALQARFTMLSGIVQR